jgi:hypothetical protein
MEKENKTTKEGREERERGKGKGNNEKDKDRFTSMTSSGYSKFKYLGQMFRELVLERRVFHKRSHETCRE